ncbi:MAG: 2-phosphosulfolactate phosphatase [Christensenellales bacterium]|jgi:2-phosphosulfolactate phosphatase
MLIDVFAAYNHVVDKYMREKTAIIVDVLRATSTIITALDNGCQQIIPADEIDEALNVAQTMKSDQVKMGGERNADKITGFEFGNSPFEYTREAVEGKTVIMTTSNGTRAIRKSRAANKVLLGGFINATAVAQAAINEGRDLCIVCAGTGQKFSMDDAMAVGAIIQRIRQLNGNLDIDSDDLGIACEMLYLKYRDNIREGVKYARHYIRLMELGLNEDIDYCLQEDIINLVPVYSDGLITI